MTSQPSRKRPQRRRWTSSLSSCWAPHPPKHNQHFKLKLLYKTPPTGDIHSQPHPVHLYLRVLHLPTAFYFKLDACWKGIMWQRLKLVLTRNWHTSWLVDGNAVNNQRKLGSNLLMTCARPDFSGRWRGWKVLLNLITASRGARRDESWRRHLDPVLVKVEVVKVQEGKAICSRRLFLYSLTWLVVQREGWRITQIFRKET